MHVLIIPSWYPTYPGDLNGSFFREMAGSLHTAGCKVGVIAPDLLPLSTRVNRLFHRGLMTAEVDNGVPTYRNSSVSWAPRKWGYGVNGMSRLAWRLYTAYVSDYGKPDVIHVHVSLLGGAAGRMIGKAENIPYIVSEHSTAYARGLVSKSGLGLAKSIAEHASGRYAVSTPFARLLERRLEMPGGSWEVIPNSVSSDFLNAKLEPRSTNSPWNFLHVSLLDKKKRGDLIIRAFARKFAGAPDIQLTIGGDGPTRPMLERLASNLGVETQVRFLGRLSRSSVREELKNCDAFVLASRHETFGVVLVEALAMGRSVIATRCGGPEDIITNETGLLVPVDDGEALANAMEIMITNRNAYNPQRMRDICNLRFGPKAITDKWLKIYGELI